MWMLTVRFCRGRQRAALRRARPTLRLIPSAIGGDRDKRTGIVLAKSIPAKKFGVTTGEPVGMALRKCPQLVLAPPDFPAVLEKLQSIHRHLPPLCARRGAGVD